MKNISKLLLLILILALNLEAKVQRVKGDYILVQTAGTTYVGNSSNQTYSINPDEIEAGDTIVIIDKGGDNTIELVGGLTISSTKVVSNELVLALSNGASINIRGADTFTFDVGANKSSGITGTKKDFDTFLQNSLGLASTPVEGQAVVNGSAVEVIIDGGNKDSGSTDSSKQKSIEVVACSTLSSEIGAEAVAVLAKYNYTKCALPFGILVANSNTKSYLGSDMEAVTKMQATIVAELIDNDQDGVADNQSVVDILKSGSTGTWMNIQSQSNEANEETILEEMQAYIARDMGVKYQWMEISNPLSEDYEENEHFKTMMAEEAIHMLHSQGFADVYPSIWGVSDDSCSDMESSSACDWEQSTLTKLAYEAMTSNDKWYRHGENSLADASGVINGTCATPSCAAVEFIMNVMVELRDIKPADSELTFPSTKTAVETKLSSTIKGQAMRTVIEDTQYAQFPKGLTYTYNPSQSTEEPTTPVDTTPSTVASKATSLTTNTRGRDEATFATSHTFVSIPATTFTMGNSQYEVLGAAPEHQVSISKEYWISKNLITNEQFNTFVQETNYISDLQKNSSEGCYVYDAQELGFVPTAGRYYANAFSNTSSLSDHPVVCVSYNDAVAYASWLSTKLSLNVALATEAQWELAAKGTSQKKFPWGNSEPDATKVNFADLQFSIDYADSDQGNPNTDIDDGYAGTSPVGNYPEGASEFGVMDMAGNAAEWVNDYYSEYTSSSLTDPTGATSGDSRVNRGGNWVDDASATEEQHTIITVSRASDDAQSADDHMGFRVVINN